MDTKNNWIPKTTSLAVATLSMVLAWPALASKPASASALAASDEPSTPKVAGGSLVDECAWPSVPSALLNGAPVIKGGPYCSATLLHPKLVLLAGHCIDPQIGHQSPDSFAFGNDAWGPAREVDVESCQMHPNYDIGQLGNGAVDLAFCTLAEAVEDVQRVPPLMGCELDVLAPNATVTIVGFGSEYAEYGAGGFGTQEGAGQKRSGLQRIQTIYQNEVFLLGDQTGACPGDSGGPAMVQLGDGSWRTIGAASRLHPNSPLNPGQNACGYGSVYTVVAPYMAWLESASGYDLTPCHDADGSWNPGPECTRLPLTPDQAAGEWVSGCLSDNLSGPSMSCGDPWDDGGSGSESGSADGGDGDGDGDGGTTTEESGDASGGETGAAGEDAGEDAGDEGVDSETGSTDGPGTDSESPNAGCACNARSSGSPWLGALLFLPLAWRRRRSAV